MRLDREVPVRSLDEVALADSPDLVGEGLLELVRNVLDHRVREDDRKRSLGKRELRSVCELDGDVVSLEPTTPVRAEVDCDDRVRLVEPLERAALTGADVEDPLVGANPAEAHEEPIPLLAPAADRLAALAQVASALTESQARPSAHEPLVAGR